MKNIFHFYKSYKKTVRSIVIGMLLFVGVFVVVDHSTTFAGYDPSICASVTEIPVSECEALVALYNSTDGDNWYQNMNRGNPAAICSSRYGVSCADSHVSQVGLGSNGLSGALPSEISNLTALTTLNLENNYISSLPTELGNIITLTSLSLAASSITSLPESLTGLINITPGNLSVGYNKLNPNDMSSELQIFLDTNAESDWRVTQNMVDVNVARAALMALYTATDGDNWYNKDNRNIGSYCSRRGITCDGYQSIVSINLSSNNLNGPIPYEFGDLTKLTSINFFDNQITDIGTGIGTLINLTGINLENNILSSLPTEIGNLTNLMILNVGGNSITSVPDELGNLINLNFLSLVSNQITSLPESLTGLINITPGNLAITYNKLNPNTMSSELQSFLDTNAESDWRDTQNMVDPNIARAALMALYNATNGEGWGRNDNRSDRNMCNRYGITCDGYGSIVSIDLSSNGLNGAIPYEFGDLTKLTSINFQYNQISDMGTGLTNLVNLTSINVGNNLLTTLPDEIGNFVGLTSLNISSNAITNLPESLTGCTNLETGVLFVGANKLDPGTMSIDLISLLDTKAESDWRDTQNIVDPNVARAALMALYNSTNGIGWNNSTNRDTWTNICTRYGVTCDGYGSIVSIDLSNNNIDGVVPYEFGDLTKLLSLNLSNNPITDISSGVANLIYLRNLNLEMVSLSSLPDELGSMTRLTGLNVRYNGLTTLPESLTGLINLETGGLYIGYNYITNTESMSAELLDFINIKAESGRQMTQRVIPSTTRAALMALYNATDGVNRGIKDNRDTGAPICTRYGITCDENNDVIGIDLNTNGLNGIIPYELGDLKKLRSLNLNQNTITSISTGIGNLTYLQTLYILGNSLSSLPDEIGTLSYLTGLDVSHNQLTSLPESLTGLSSMTPGNLFVGYNSISNISSMSSALLSFVHTNAEANRQLTQQVSLSTMYDALTALYNATDGANWVEKTNWTDTGVSYCSRYGILCDGNSNITQINLSNNGLSGVLPDEIENMFALEFLWINNNSITSIGSGVSRLRNIIAIDVSNNLLTSLPESLTGVVSLSDLGLQIAGNSISPIPMSHGLIVFLNTKVGAHRQGSQYIPSDLVYESLIALYNATDGPNWTNQNNWLDTGVTYCDRYGISCDIPYIIKEIGLGDNNLSGSLPTELGNIYTLYSFILGYDNITSIQEVDWNNLTNLFQLSLNYLQLSNLPTSFTGLFGLTTLTIDYNYIHPYTISSGLNNFMIQKNGESRGATQFVTEGNTYDALIALYNTTDGDNWIDKTNWTDTGVSYCERYGVSCEGGQVTTLALGSNNLSGYLPHELGQLFSLTTLVLSNNNLSSVESGVAYLGRLGSLSLTHNLLTTLPEEVSNLSSLNSIELGENCWNLDLMSESLVTFLDTRGGGWRHNSVNGSCSVPAFDCNTVTDVPAAECEALVRIYGQLSRYQRTVRDGRLDSTQVEDRYGVTVSDGHVYDITLSTKYLSGELTAGMFSGLNSLASLNLDNNQISAIESGAFYGLTNLTNLILNGNQISTIESGAFAGLTNLSYINLNGNQISTIGSGTLNGLTNLSSLDLQNNQISTIESGAFAGLANLTNLGFNSNQISGIEIGDLNGLTNLINLDLYDNQISTIESGAFAGLANLTNLGFSYNQISIIESGAFEGLTNLTYLSLNGNQISAIDSGDFNGLTNLTSLDIVYNQISAIESGTFEGLTNLTYLNLNSNQISIIESWAFNGLTNLDYLYLNTNQLTTLGDLTFVGLTGISKIELTDNQIQTISTGAFSGMSSIGNLFLDGNEIVILPVGVFSGLGNLQNLYLHGNKLSRIDSGLFVGLGNVTYLRLDNNLISSIPTNAFTGLAHLNTLSLTNNQISSIESGDFNGLIGNLNQIGLYGNKIESIEIGDFNGLTKLATLDLRYNQITTIQSGAFLSGNGFPVLSSLSLGNNCHTQGTTSIPFRVSSTTSIDSNNCVRPTLSTTANFIASLTGKSYSLSGGYYRGSYAINFGYPGISNIFPVNVAMNQSNVTRAEYASGTTIVYNGGASFSGILHSPYVFDITNVPDATEVVSLIKFGSLVARIEFDQDVSVRMPATGKNSGDLVGIYSSDEQDIFGPNGPHWIFEQTGVVQMDGSTPYVSFATRHATWFLLGSATATTFDTTPPVGTITYTPGSGSLTSGNVIATLSGSEDIIVTNNSGLTGYTFTGDGTFTFQFEDLAGNTGNVTATVNRIDKTKPVGTITYSPTSGSNTSGDVVATITLDETGTITNNDGLTGYTFTGDGTFTFEFRDTAGNTGNVTATVDRIDKTKPVGTITYAPTSGTTTSGDVVATITLDETGTITNNSGSTGYTFTDTGSFAFTFIDLAGNTGSATATVTWIDKTPQVGPGGGPGYTPPQTPTTGLLCSAFSPELNGAYTFAFTNGITTIKDCQQANLTGTLQRSHLAKMISQFAVKVMNMKIDTTKACSFSDIGEETPEIQLYIRTACQLGLMGYDDNGNQSTTFDPFATVNRAQFGTILSRVLRGTKYNGADPYYLKHLNALKLEGIMTNISQPLVPEIRGRVMLMLQRIKNPTK